LRANGYLSSENSARTCRPYVSAHALYIRSCHSVPTRPHFSAPLYCCASCCAPRCCQYNILLLGLLYHPERLRSAAGDTRAQRPRQGCQASVLASGRRVLSTVSFVPLTPKTLWENTKWGQCSVLRGGQYVRSFSKITLTPSPRTKYPPSPREMSHTCRPCPHLRPAISLVLKVTGDHSLVSYHFLYIFRFIH